MTFFTVPVIDVIDQLEEIKNGEVISSAAQTLW